MIAYSSRRPPARVNAGTTLTSSNETPRSSEFLDSQRRPIERERSHGYSTLRSWYLRHRPLRRQQRRLLQHRLRRLLLLVRRIPTLPQDALHEHAQLRAHVLAQCPVDRPRKPPAQRDSPSSPDLARRHARRHRVALRSPALSSNRALRDCGWCSRPRAVSLRCAKSSSTRGRNRRCPAPLRCRRRVPV